MLDTFFVRKQFFQVWGQKIVVWTVLEWKNHISNERKKTEIINWSTRIFFCMKFSLCRCIKHDESLNLFLMLVIRVLFTKKFFIKFCMSLNNTKSTHARIKFNWSWFFSFSCGQVAEIVPRRVSTTETPATPVETRSRYSRKFPEVAAVLHGRGWGRNDAKCDDRRKWVSETVNHWCGCGRPLRPAGTLRNPSTRVHRRRETLLCGGDRRWHSPPRKWDSSRRECTATF